MISAMPPPWSAGFAKHGFAVDLRDNEGTRVCVASSRLEYAYCRRS